MSDTPDEHELRIPPAEVAAWSVFVFGFSMGSYFIFWREVEDVATVLATIGWILTGVGGVTALLLSGIRHIVGKARFSR